MPEFWQLWHLCGFLSRVLSFELLVFDPDVGQQGREVLRAGVMHEFIENPFKVGVRILPVAADLFYEGVDDGVARSVRGEALMLPVG